MWDASAMANPRPQDEQPLRGALRCKVFSKNVSKYTEQGGRRQCSANTQLGFRIGIKAACTDPRHPSAVLVQPWLHCPLVARQGPAGRF